MTAPHDGWLLQRVASGPPEAAREALRELYQRHAPAVLSFATQTLLDEARAQDVLQEVFLRVARHAGRFRAPHEQASALPWLCTLAANLCRNVERSERRRGEREERAARPEVRADDSADARLDAALAALPRGERQAVELHHVQGLTFDQVSGALGIAPRTARYWARRGLDKLRSRLEEDA